MRSEGRVVSAVLLALVPLTAVRALAQGADRHPQRLGDEQVECHDGTLVARAPDACVGRGGVARHVHITARGATSVYESRTVLCRDGTTMTKKDGACSEHGGEAAPLSPSSAPATADRKSVV